MTSQSIAIAISAVATTCLVYLWIAVRQKKYIHSVSDYLPLKKNLSANQYRGTTVAAGMSLATVMIALINLSPIIGIALLVTIATYAIGFACLYLVVHRIISSNPKNSTIPDYLGMEYKSSTVRNVAAIFTLVGYLSIFAMEIFVGVTVLGVFFKDLDLLFAFIYFLFLVTYTWLSGFRGIVATDVWQLRFIFASIASLFGYFFWSLGTHGIDASFANFDSSLFTTWNATISFVLGIAVMNILAPISDTGTWQRVCATRNLKETKKGLRGAIFLFILLWSALIIIGCFHSAFADIRNSFDLSSSTLMNELIRGMANHATEAPGLFLFIFLLGLFSAMVSTADSLLIAATHILSNFFQKTFSHAGNQPAMLLQTKIYMLVIATISFILFSIFYLLDFNVVQLVFAIYGAHLALFPSTFGALMLTPRIKEELPRLGVALSVILGFIAAWVFAVGGHIFSSQDVQFYAPVASLIVSSLVFLLSLLFALFKSWRRSVDII